MADGLAKLSATLRESDADPRRLLTATPPAAAALITLLRDLEPTIGTLLGNLVSTGGVAARRLPGIEQVLVVYPLVVAGGFTVTPGDGTAHLGLVVNINDPPACEYGTSPRCSAADRARGSGVRGNTNAPRPGGTDPATGLAVAADGSPLWFGTTGGQGRLAGDHSWKQLLLAGLAP